VNLNVLRGSRSRKLGEKAFLARLKVYKPAPVNWQPVLGLQTWGNIAAVIGIGGFAGLSNRNGLYAQ
jgi:hypothetical protein